ncbi:MAG: hypothetical protein J6X07_10415 [Prevotella sp.]|nr:hypothetical protein [Prevotella sp.]
MDVQDEPRAHHLQDEAGPADGDVGNDRGDGTGEDEFNEGTEGEAREHHADEYR